MLAWANARIYSVLCNPVLWRLEEASEIAKHVFPPWNFTLAAPLTELILLTSMPSSLSSRPQYPEFSQEREDSTKAVRERAEVSL